MTLFLKEVLLSFGLGLLLGLGIDNTELGSKCLDVVKILIERIVVPPSSSKEQDTIPQSPDSLTLNLEDDMSTKVNTQSQKKTFDELDSSDITVDPKTIEKRVRRLIDEGFYASPVVKDLLARETCRLLADKLTDDTLYRVIVEANSELLYIPTRKCDIIDVPNGSPMRTTPNYNLTFFG